MSGLRIYLSQECIDHGIRNNCQKCPAALAVEAAFHGAAKDIIVGCRYIKVTLLGTRFVSRTPRALEHFITRFDNRERVRPFWVTLERAFRVPLAGELIPEDHPYLNN